MAAKKQEEQKIEAVPVEEEDEGRLVPAVVQEGVEIDVQVTTAHRYPRSVQTYRRVAESMATADQDTAASCIYSIKRGGKLIEGPSVRMAEIVGSAWGNLRYGSRVVREEEKCIVAQGSCHDLQSNVACCVEVRRRITDKEGRRYNDDMVGVTANAACSIALRNAIFRVVPQVFVTPIYEAARKVAIGNANTLTKRRQAAVDFFHKLGVLPEQLFEYLEIKGMEDIDLDVLTTLTGLKTAIAEGTAQVESLFPPKPVMPQRKSEAEKKENGK